MTEKALLEGTLKKLEFGKIKEKLEQFTSTLMGQERVRELYPIRDIALINNWHRETSEAVKLLRLEPEVPMGNLNDIRPFLRRLSKGAVLEADEILAIARVLSASRRLKKFLLDRKENYPILAEISSSFIANHTLEEEINKSILDTGEISDHASPELYSIRRSMKSIQENIKEKLDHILRSTETQKYLQENLVTFRNDRYVVPVRQEYRSQFPGIIHDQSASGATIFVEPMAIVEKNNDLRRLRSQEKQEIIRILTHLSSEILKEEAALSTGISALGQLDFILAKGRLSKSMDGGEPLLNDEGYLDIKKARHPLITGKVVPISVHLGKTFDTLVITGPNTGGKTVTLKTVGLLTLMAQSGLHLPAETGSEVCIFNNIYADIGDEQSIEQSLSTFSSHITNIINILQEVDGGCLVLLDELGAGTDPTEGAALAMAILDHLHQNKVKTIATTHYSELKTFAFERPRIENASVEFDIQTLKPTYRLNIGRPGHSSAFDIAAGLGLENQVIEKAKGFLTHEELAVADLIQELEANRRAAEKEYEEVHKEKMAMEQVRNKYDSMVAEIDKKKAGILEKARQEVGEIRRKARLEAGEILEELKTAQNERDIEKARVVRNKLKELSGDLPKETFQLKNSGLAITKVTIGQRVFIPKLDQEGIVQSKPDANGEVQIMVGVMKINLKLAELRQVAKGGKAEKGTTYSRIMSNKALNIKQEVDLRGMTVDEALEEVDKYLDDAALAGLPRVNIIHGKGTGALREAINSFLRINSHVKSYRPGQYGEGGSGVTIVEIK